MLDLLLMMLCGQVCAGGPIHGAKAAGMGTAFIAVVDDPSAILFNPAGLTQLGELQIYGGGTAVMLNTEFEKHSGDQEDTDFQVFFPPHFFIASPLGTADWSFGIGFHSLFGIGGRKWSQEGLLRYGSTDSAVATFDVNPTLAWQATPWLSVAVGLDYLWGINHTERMVDQSMLDAEDGGFELEADGDGWGWNAGLLLRANEKLRFGFSYRSGIEVDVKGDAKLKNIAPPLQPAFGGASFKTKVASTQDFPEIYGFGVAYDPDARWTLALDVELVRWSSFDELMIDFEREVPEAGFVDGSIRQDWDDSFQVKIGADHRLTESVSLRGGYSFIQASVPDETLEPGNPDADQHNLSLGVGVRRGDWWVDGFYNFGFFEKRTVDNDVVSGTFDSTVHFVGVSVGRRFP